MRRPSSRVTLRAAANDSVSLTFTVRSTSDGSNVVGQKSSPTPSTRYGRPVPPEYTEPSGSAATICTAGFCALRYRATPVMVPPVPTPATKCVTLPSVCRQISGPVERSCSAGLAGLEYWSGRNAPGVSRVRRSATE